MGKGAATRGVVSVILPTYDRPEMLAKAARTVADQTYSPIELIVVDDYSPTPAREVLNQTDLGDLRWRCLRHDVNRGANAARNTGINAATGSYLAFLDDDDRWVPTKLARQIDALERAPTEVGVVVVGQASVDDTETRTATRRPSLEGNVTEQLLRGRSGGTFSAILVSRDLVDLVGLPDEGLPSWQDRDWLIRLSTRAQFTSIPDILVIRRVGTHGQISDDFTKKRDQSYPILLNKHARLAHVHGCSRAFRSTLAKGVASSALSNGEYLEAIRFSLRAIGSDPRDRLPYLYLMIALGGDITYSAATRFHRHLQAGIGE